MKLTRITTDTLDGPEQRIVAVQPENNRVVDLARAYRLVQERRGATTAAAAVLARTLFPASMSAAIAAGPAFLDAAEQALAAADDASTPMGEVTWAAAVDPPVIRDCLTYPLHMKNFAEKIGAGAPPRRAFVTPPYFKGSTGVVYGHDAEIAYPALTEHLDYELEIGIVVGSEGSDLTPEQAEEHIFGYTIFNDFSARDLQFVEASMGMGPQKTKDFAYGIGPWIVTRDEFPPVEKLTGTVTVNGEQWSTCVGEGAIFSPAELIAWISLGDVVQPGDLVGTGTLGGGAAIEIGRRLNPGDVLELQLDGVGVLRNTIGPRASATWRPTEKPYPFDDSAAEAGH
ncbi:fumarylacetoacetate hydrolase family protein [Streptomyces griseorubiginosus]|uniref:fumarylacetoacetate hydrolase family protein n=1 Tax=Streptomyces griseorubiginosus TaxID=67304 RepID=UPI0011403194|nr:fumarylacetoacetate hydrolase family protein [Streptomyces griseorubiginosus]